MWVFLYMWMQCPKCSERDSELLELKWTPGVWYGSWKLNLGALQGYYVLLATEPSHQSQLLLFFPLRKNLKLEAVTKWICKYLVTHYCSSRYLTYQIPAQLKNILKTFLTLNIVRMRMPIQMQVVYKPENFRFLPPEPQRSEGLIGMWQLFLWSHLQIALVFTCHQAQDIL